MNQRILRLLILFIFLIQPEAVIQQLRVLRGREQQRCVAGEQQGAARGGGQGSSQELQQGEARAGQARYDGQCDDDGDDNDGDDVQVRRGDIYGLLGASGCGKTSLLSVLVGRRRLDSGSLAVMGGKPGDRR